MMQKEISCSDKANLYLNAKDRIATRKTDIFMMLEIRILIFPGLVFMMIFDQ